MRSVIFGLNSRINLITGIALVGFAIVGALSIRTIGTVTGDERQARARVVVEAASKIVQFYEAKVARGDLPEAAAKDAAKEALRAVRFDGNEYILILEQDGTVAMSGMFKDRDGRSALDNKDANGVYFSREMIKAAQAGGGFTEYSWPKAPNTPPQRKVAYALQSGAWKWVVCSGVYLDDVEAAVWRNAATIAGVGGSLAVLIFGAAFWLARRITLPILRLTAVTNRIADGDLAVAVPGQGRRDEIGSLAHSIGVLKRRSEEASRLSAEQDQMKAEAAREHRHEMDRLANAFEASVMAVVGSIASSAGTIENAANALSASSQLAERETTSAADAAEQTSGNVGTVASATEELSASIQEISRQIAHSSRIASGAMDEAGEARVAMTQLAEAAKRVGAIVDLIQDIASQTNLLALNATIEAARAGEAGKGFAVVAGEVKALAAQTARATDEIQATVSGIESISGTAVSRIQEVGVTVTRMNEITAAIAAAIEEQGAATREIADNIANAAESTRRVSGNVDVARQAVDSTTGVARTVLDAAGALSEGSKRLNREVSNFLGTVRAA
ncbi:methyl-accepting chemotaxis protein [Azospirillum sp. 412522]|nr:methyl-accepting chemotaxis protein [Azospirillum sp. 412522]MBY6263672.1 methyl-accepting chemotaxis protein [Azospirillum sp. 412522]